MNLDKLINEAKEIYIEMMQGGKTEKIQEKINQYPYEEKGIVLYVIRQFYIEHCKMNPKYTVPDCHECRYSEKTPWSHHLTCRCKSAVVEGSEHGISHGWFCYPFDYDPIWLEFCDSFEEKDKE